MQPEKKIPHTAEFKSAEIRAFATRLKQHFGSHQALREAGLQLGEALLAHDDLRAEVWRGVVHSIGAARQAEVANPGPMRRLSDNAAAPSGHGD